MSKGKPKPKRKAPVPRMAPAHLATLARQFVEGKIFSSAHMDEHDLQHLQLVFMPIAFGALSDVDTRQIGIIYEEISAADAIGRSINGMPIFASCRLLHADDWTIVRGLIESEEREAKEAHERRTREAAEMTTKRPRKRKRT